MVIKTMYRRLADYAVLEVEALSWTRAVLNPSRQVESVTRIGSWFHWLIVLG